MLTRDMSNRIPEAQNGVEVLPCGCRKRVVGSNVELDPCVPCALAGVAGRLGDAARFLQAAADRARQDHMDQARRGQHLHIIGASEPLAPKKVD